MGKSSNLANLLSGTGKIDSDDIEVGATVSNNYSTSAYVSNTSFEALKSNSLGRRNLIINGAMEVNQRGAAGSPTNASGYQILDRYYVGASGYTIDKKSTDTPSNTGLEYCLSHVRPSHTSGSVSQFIELPATGKAGVFWNGNKVTASCYVKGVSGDTFSIKIRFSTGSGGTDGSDFSSVTGQSLTLDGTWQKYENTIDVDQSVGGSDTAVRFILSYSNGAVGNETLVTGLQLELGETATPFEHRSYGEELALCQRYYQELTIPLDYTPNDYNANALYRSYTLPTTMRANGTAEVVTQLRYWNNGSANNFTPNNLFAFVDRVRVDGTGLTSARGFVDGKISMDAEL